MKYIPYLDVWPKIWPMFPGSTVGKIRLQFKRSGNLTEIITAKLLHVPLFKVCEQIIIIKYSFQRNEMFYNYRFLFFSNNVNQSRGKEFLKLNKNFDDDECNLTMTLLLWPFSSLFLILYSNTTFSLLVVRNCEF